MSRRRVVSYWLAGWLLLFGAAFRASAEAAEGGENLSCLFVIDTSPSMAAKKKAVARTVRDLIASGFHNQIQPGEKIGLWVVNGQAQPAAFAPFAWEAERRDALAEAASSFILDAPFSKTSRLDQAAAPLKAALNASTNLLVFLFHAGGPLKWGLPVERDLNPIYAANLNRMRRENRPFVTMLRIQQGVVTDWKVHTTEDLLELPAPPPRPAPEAAKAVVLLATAAETRTAIHSTNDSAALTAAPVERVVPPAVESKKSEANAHPPLAALPAAPPLAPVAETAQPKTNAAPVSVAREPLAKPEEHPIAKPEAAPAPDSLSSRESPPPSRPDPSPAPSVQVVPKPAPSLPPPAEPPQSPTSMPGYALPLGLFSLAAGLLFAWRKSKVKTTRSLISSSISLEKISAPTRTPPPNGPA